MRSRSGAWPAGSICSGSISNIGFYVDGVFVATDATSPYAATIPYTLLPEGQHTLIAYAGIERDSSEVYSATRKPEEARREESLAADEKAMAKKLFPTAPQNFCW